MLQLETTRLCTRHGPMKTTRWCIGFTTPRSGVPHTDGLNVCGPRALTGSALSHSTKGSTSKGETIRKTNPRPRLALPSTAPSWPSEANTHGAHGQTSSAFVTGPASPTKPIQSSQPLPCHTLGDKSPLNQPCSDTTRRAGSLMTEREHTRHFKSVQRRTHQHPSHSPGTFLQACSSVFHADQEPA